MDLKARVTNVLTKPKQEWPLIASEPGDVVQLYKEYVMPLAAIPTICGFLGMTFIGVTVPSIGTLRTPMVSGLTGSIIEYVLTLVGIYLGAYIVAKLAPTFQSSGGIVQALKMVAYASTAGWIAGVLRLIPALTPLIFLAALYGVYLFYLGLPVVMKTPPDKIVPYMVVSAVVIIVISVVMASLSGGFVGVSRILS
jgi:Yip1 domain